MKKYKPLLIEKINNPQINTPEFKKWFGNSKVVDSKGKPLVVYHTTDKDFNEFKTSGKIKTVAGDIENKGIYFTPNQGEYKHKGGIVKEVYLSIKNPFITTNQLDVAVIKPNEYNNFISKGYDGIILMRKGIPDEYVAFHSNQIKSATGNNGNFSIHSNKITENNSNNKEVPKHTA